MMPRTSQVLRIEPPEALTFKGPFTEVVKATLTLTNPSDTNVAFKVKTTAPKRYCVRPNSGSLSKDESISISVMLQPFDFDPHEKTKHKFMIQSLLVTPDLADKDVWADVDKDKLMDTKLRVVFDNDLASKPLTEEDEPNNLDITPDPVQMTPHKANLMNTTNTITSNKIQPASGDDGNSMLVKDNARLAKEVESLKEEAQRLRRIAMKDTMSTSSPSTTTQSGANSTLPTGVSLLFHESTNVLILLVLIIASFTAGLFLSDSLLGA